MVCFLFGNFYISSCNEYDMINVTLAIWKEYPEALIQVFFGAWFSIVFIIGIYIAVRIA